MEIKPITPDEIINNLEKIIPSVVIQAVNNLLKEKYRGLGSTTIKQDEIVREIQKLGSDLTKSEIYDKKYLDFEKLYSSYGWDVTYDSPARDENFDAYFTFKKIK